MVLSSIFAAESDITPFNFLYLLNLLKFSKIITIFFQQKKLQLYISYILHIHLLYCNNICCPFVVRLLSVCCSFT
jgi:hypothetical protein